MRACVQTRGMTADYAFLGSAPATRWWLVFREATSFEKPTIIVRGDRNEWRCYLSGIPSKRTDRVGTAIRYTIVLEGRCSDAGSDALRLVAAWLEDAASSEPGRRVQVAMDAAFDEATVERLLSSRTAGAEAAAEVEQRAARALTSLPSTPELTIFGEAGSWAGSTSSFPAQRQFLALSAALLRGERAGAAARLNLLGTADEVGGLAEQVGPLGALIEDPAGALGDAVVTVEKKKQGEAPADRTPSRPENRWVAIGLLLGVIALVIWMFLPKPRPPPPPPNPSHQR